MHSPYLDKLSKEEYKTLQQKLFNIQSGVCYICGQKIDIDIQETDVDHVVPLNSGGKDDEGNFALTHSSCNRSKQDAHLEVARALHKLKKLQEHVQVTEKRSATLKDVLAHEGGSNIK